MDTFADTELLSKTQDDGASVDNENVDMNSRRLTKKFTNKDDQVSRILLNFRNNVLIIV